MSLPLASPACALRSDSVGRRSAAESDLDSMPPLSPAQRRHVTTTSTSAQEDAGVMSRLFSSVVDAGSPVHSHAKRRLDMSAASVDLPPGSVGPLATTNQSHQRAEGASHAHTATSHRHRSRATRDSKRRKVTLDESAKSRFFAHFEQLHASLEEETMEEMQAEENPISTHISTSDFVRVAGEGFSSLAPLPRLPSPPPAVADHPSSEITPAAAAASADRTASNAAAAASPLTSMPSLQRAKTAASRAPWSPSSRADRSSSAAASSHSVPCSPAKPRGTADTAISHSPPLFDALRLVLLQGPDLTSKRCELLAVQVVRRGGRVTIVSADTVAVQHDKAHQRKQHPTHVLFGGVSGGHRVREYARELQSQLKPRHFDAIAFLSVEWLTACLQRGTIAGTERYRLRTETKETSVPHSGDAMAMAAGEVDLPISMSFATVPAFSPTPPTETEGGLHSFAPQPPTAAPSSFAHVPTVPASAAALAAAARMPKRDIRYVLESRERTASAVNESTHAHYAMKTEALLSIVKKESVVAATSLGVASSSSSPPAVVSSSYVQPVPNFAAAAPFDSHQHLPLSTGASYLNPDVQVDAGASFLQPGEESAAAPPSAAAASSSASSSGPTSSSLVLQHHPLPSSRRAGAWIERNKAHLACQMMSSQHKNLNAHLTGPLEKLESMNGSLGDKWRTYAYRKAVGILKKYPTRISTQEDVLALGGIRGLGQKLLDKLSELIATGSLQKVSAMEKNDLIATMALFSKIHGVGSATAQKWFTWGLRTIADVVRDPRVELTDSQRVGVRFMEDKAQRIPRLEVKSILEYVSRIANRILLGVTVICCGSFRRGAPNSGDVDLLFTHPTFTTRALANDAEDPESVKQREAFLKRLLAVLHEPIVEGSQRWNEERAWCMEKYQASKLECDRIKQEFAAKVKPGDATPSPPPVSANSDIARLAAANPHLTWLQPPSQSRFLTGDLSTFEKVSTRHASAVYMGFCSLPSFHPFHSGVHRRVDIKVYPAAHFPFALLYFTGSDHFNRCWGAGTELMMHDGTSKSVEQIIAGDRLMGPDSLPRVVRAGSLVHGNTGFDAAVRSAEQFAPPATYRIRSDSLGRQTWTCNEQHILVLQWHQRPSLTKDTARHQSRLTFFRLVSEHDVLRPIQQCQTWPLSASGHHRKQVRRAYKHVSATWESLTWEVSVADFMAYPVDIRSSCKMFSPRLVQFPTLPESRAAPRSLSARLTLLMRELGLLAADGQVDADFERQSAWLLGMWIADGSVHSTGIAQIHPQRPTRSHAAVIYRLKRWLELASGARLVNGVVSETDGEEDDSGDDTHTGDGEDTGDQTPTLTVNTDDEDDTTGATLRSKAHLNALSPESQRSVSGMPFTSSSPFYDVEMCPLLHRLLASYNMTRNKHLPHDLLHESKQIRTALLAGVIDGSGCYTATDHSHAVRGDDSDVMSQLRFLARSLGHSVGSVCESPPSDSTSRSSFIIHIGGDQLTELNSELVLPHTHANDQLGRTQFDPRAVGFTCTKEAHADYYGFQVHGPDSRILMSDFVVTHNSMRFFAKKKMWTLSDKGLAPAIRVNGDKVWSGKSVYCATEKDVFDALGLLYVPPEQRNVYAHFELTEEEMRMLKHNNALQADDADTTWSDEEKRKLIALDAMPTSVATPAAAAGVPSSAASSSSPPVVPPLGLPLKQEVQVELAEMDEVRRAALGLRRLAAEEEAIRRNQVAQLEKQV